jgi:hypothetical protein
LTITVTASIQNNYPLGWLILTGGPLAMGAMPKQFALKEHNPLALSQNYRLSFNLKSSSFNKYDKTYFSCFFLPKKPKPCDTVSRYTIDFNIYF